MRAYLGRRYRFNASHRLHAASMSDEENRAAFGKCNNPHGHGHNYTVEVVYGGEVDGATGMVADLAALDAFAREHVLGVLDGQNLNCVAWFSEHVPSTEYLAMAMHREFARFPGATLERLHVEETGNNSFDYFGGSLPAANGTEGLA